MPNAMRSRKATSEAVTDEVDAQRLAAVEAQMLRIEGLMADIRRLATTEIDGLRSELAHRAGELGDDIMATRRQIATEVRTRRVVVVNEEGFEGVVAEAGHRVSKVTVTSQEDPSVWTTIHASDESGVASGLYLSGGGNGAGSFEVLGEVYGVGVDDPEAIEYSASLDITPASQDPRFHNVTLDREGLHYGG